ncbi:MAG: metal-dependent transcriptional regulator [Lachnospiraceae bacterium]|nr:metal-dependent transcriptional regulator [Lachnospiraceae bacterium]
MRKNESAENYLETIYILSKKLPVVRSVDIATELNFKKPSVSVAMKHLREKELIVVSDAGFITLTEEGQAQAEAIYERHTILTKMFVMLGVSEETAAEDACLIEHILSDESFEAIKKHLKEKGAR